MYIENKEDFIKNGAAGDWSFDKEEDTIVAIFLNTPDGTFVRLPLVGQNAWQWNGDLLRPTLTPSILKMANWNKKEWHGYLTNGEFITL